MSDYTLSRVQRGETYSGYTTLEVMCCPTCGVLYGVPERLLDNAREKPNLWWYCPNGHNLHFPGKSSEQKLKDLQNDLARERARHDQTEASLRATKGVVTRQKKKLEKVVAGVCPVDGCKRHFKDLRRHISTKHPDYHGEANK